MTTIMTTLENAEITARNSTSSPLLRLPAELRIEVYAYAVGGHLLHVRFKPPKVAAYHEICFCLSHVSRPLAPSRLTGYDWDFEHKLHHCEPAVSICNITLVCRQVATESWNFQFRYNTLNFHEIFNLYAFILRSSPTRLSAIIEIRLSTEEFNTMLRAHEWEDAISSLPNLKRIIVMDKKSIGPSRRLAYTENLASNIRQQRRYQRRSIELIDETMDGLEADTFVSVTV
ncbi:hypothetical protein K491DRAFT_722462 [Lophiostoma macrostomum CBS 122681]|uniref:DUF7730 domain-containing protein n=1 Tax=Lophiostoma macrostomum CBS 122681 TaxID=1314788 RepID=A0A6A6SNL5_9PLEO|nr:hypothetical protein K491DRAFT_722462 [Lophiostoma macrostomum CBS 122681]